MNRLVVSVIWMVLATAFVGCSMTGGQNLTPQNAAKTSIEPQCLSGEEFAGAVKTLSTANVAYSEVNETQQRLIHTAKKSNACRTEVISLLINSMDKPDLDFTQDEGSYLLWLNGAEILGELKAAESLDLLVSHLDQRTRTFSLSMNHMPAVRGVIKMGSVALPRLETVLKSDSRASMRHAAVYCIATIGGPAAVQSLREALPMESDKCVSRFIRISLDSFDDSGNIKDRGKWFSGVVCNE